MVAAAAATALRVRLGGVAAAHAGRDARPPWAEVAENAALEPPSQRVALRSPGWLLCMCSIVVAFHGRASKVCGVVGEAATSRCLGGPEAPLEASPDDACAREPRPGSAETGAAAAPGSASAIIKDSPGLPLHLRFSCPFRRLSRAALHRLEAVVGREPRNWEMTMLPSSSAASKSSSRGSPAGTVGSARSVGTCSTLGYSGGNSSRQQKFKLCCAHHPSCASRCGWR